MTRSAADKILSKVFNSQIYCKELLNGWTVKWQMKFKVNIRKERHMEKHNVNCIHGMMGPK